MLAAGVSIGPYEIVSTLGSGGMGQVYRARDPKLGRLVAVKVLSDRLAGDPAALARFEREARAVAALSHPNILGIHDFGTDGGSPYAVMELLEGKTLREVLAAAGDAATRIRKGSDEGASALPIRKALSYASQIASGLSAAHEKGIVHRDLKPENIFITADGRVKILDFGLARVLEPLENDTRTKQMVSSVSPNVSTLHADALETDPGTLLGTVGYMSPEQVRGQTTDARTDIFSFGAVLYEMLSGRRAFFRVTPQLIRPLRFWTATLHRYRLLFTAYRSLSSASFSAASKSSSKSAFSPPTISSLRLKHWRGIPLRSTSRLRRRRFLGDGSDRWHWPQPAR